MATIRSGNMTITTNKDGSTTRTITNPGGSSITTTYNSNGTRASETTNVNRKSSGNNGSVGTTYYYGGGSNSGGSGATQTTYIDANGDRKTGYIINGKTYQDAAGTTEIPYGSTVTTADGQQWVKTAQWGAITAEEYQQKAAQAKAEQEAFLRQYQQQQPQLYAQQLQQQAAAQPSAAMEQLQSQLDQVTALLEQSLAYNDTTYAAQLEQVRAKLQQQIEALNRQYKQLNVQLYRDYMNSQKNLPQALAAQGYSGGMTESSMLGLDTAYQGQLAANERERMAGISDLEAGGLNSELELQIAQAQANQEARDEAYNRGAALYAQMLQQQNLEDERALEEYDRAYTRAMEAAQLGANYGDYSGLDSLGFDTSAARGTAYGYAADGSSYSVGSYAGLDFVQNKPAGSTMKGGDGSVWTKNADGSVSIVKNGKTYTVAAPTVAASGGGSYSGAAVSGSSDQDYSGGADTAGTMEAIKQSLDQLAASGADWAVLLSRIHDAQDDGVISTAEEYRELYQHISGLFGR